jgi:glycerol uptake facilitator-like aquaporin
LLLGGHLNPAVSFSMFLIGRLSFLKFILYSIAQFCGAFLASLMVFIVYFNQIQTYPAGMFSLETASIFSTYPSDLNEPINSLLFSFLNELFSTALFIILVLAATDKRNGIPPVFAALIIGFSLLVIGSAFSLICGNAINPARDLAPRYFTLIAGWGLQVITAGNYFFW